MLPLFRAVVKFCSTNRLFTNLQSYVQGSRGFWKVMEIDNVIFPGPENFAKEKFLKMAIEKF